MSDKEPSDRGIGQHQEASQNDDNSQMNISKASRGRTASAAKSHVSDENVGTNSENKYEGNI